MEMSVLGSLSRCTQGAAGRNVKPILAPRRVSMDYMDCMDRMDQMDSRGGRNINSPAGYRADASKGISSAREPLGCQAHSNCTP